MPIKLKEEQLEGLQENGNGKRGEYISLGSVKKGTKDYEFVSDLKTALEKKNIALRAFVLKALKEAVE